MSNLRALLRLEIKARFGRRGIPIKTLIIRSVLGTLFGGVIYLGYIYLVYSIVAMFHAYEYDYSVVQLFTFISQVFLIAFGVSSVIKNLYHSGDNELLLRFPVNSTSIFLCKATVLLIIQAVGALLLTMPFYIIYGLETNAVTEYYFSTIFVYIFSLAFSLSLAIVLSIPTMIIAARFRHKHLFTLLFNSVLVAGFFAVYMALINGVVGFARNESLTFFSEEAMQYIEKLK